MLNVENVSAIQADAHEARDKFIPAFFEEFNETRRPPARPTPVLGYPPHQKHGRIYCSVKHNHTLIKLISCGSNRRRPETGSKHRGENCSSCYPVTLLIVFSTMNQNHRPTYTHTYNNWYLRNCHLEFVLGIFRSNIIPSVNTILNFRQKSV